MIDRLVLNYSTFFDFHVRNRPNAAIARYLVIREIQPSFGPHCFGEDHIIVSLDVVGDGLLQVSVNDRVDVVKGKREASISLEKLGN